MASIVIFFSTRLDLGGVWQWSVWGEGTVRESRVPGTVLGDMLAAGLVEDPFWRDNEYAAREIFTQDFEYSTTFYMTTEQLDEFEKIMEGDRETMAELVRREGNYRQDELYQKMVGEYGADASVELLTEYVSIKWLLKNRPDFREIVEGVVEELRGEVARDKEKVLG